MEMQNIGDFSDLIDSDIALLQATSKIGVVNSYFSGHVGPTHGYLKSHLKAALGIDENSDFGDKNFLNALRESLQEMYALVFEGAVELATKVELKDFSLSFFMDYALSTNKDWSSVDVQVALSQPQHAPNRPHKGTERGRVFPFCLRALPHHRQERSDNEGTSSQYSHLCK